MATYFDRRRDLAEAQRHRRAELIRRFVAVADRAGARAEAQRRIDLADEIREDWRREMARRGWSRFSRPQPGRARRGDLALRDLRDVEAILCALCWPKDPRRLEYGHRKGRPNPYSAVVFDRYRLGQPEAWTAFIAHLPRRLRRRLQRKPSLARTLARRFRATVRNGTGRRPKHTHPDTLARALGAVLLGVDERTIERAPARVYRQLGVPLARRRPRNRSSGRSDT